MYEAWQTCSAARVLRVQGCSSLVAWCGLWPAGKTLNWCLKKSLTRPWQCSQLSINILRAANAGQPLNVPCWLVRPPPCGNVWLFGQGGLSQPCGAPESASIEGRSAVLTCTRSWLFDISWLDLQLCWAKMRNLDVISLFFLSAPRAHSTLRSKKPKEVSQEVWQSLLHGFRVPPCFF